MVSTEPKPQKGNEHMGKHIQLTYLRSHGFMYKCDAISKLIWVVLMTIAVYSYRSPLPMLAFPLLLLLLALIGAHIPLKTILASFSIFIIFGSLSGFFQLLTNADVGNEITVVLGLRITDESIQIALRLLLKLATVGCTALLFLWTTTPREFSVALITLGVPYRFGFAILVALRFLPLMKSEFAKIKDARTIRGQVPAKGLKGVGDQIRIYIFPLLVNGLRKSESTAISMDSRAFGLYTKRTYTDKHRFTWQGIALILVTVALIVAMALIFNDFGYVSHRYGHM